MKWTPWILLLGLLGYAGAQSCRDKQVWSAWEQDTVRLLRTVDGLKSQRAIVERERDSLRSVANRFMSEANRQHRSVLQLKGEGDSLRSALESAANAPDSLQVAITALNRYRVALDTSLAVIVAQKGVIRLLERDTTSLSVQLRDEQASVNSLAALIRRTPEGCKVLFLPCPKLVAGYGATLSNGRVVVGPTIGLAFPLGKR